MNETKHINKNSHATRTDSQAHDSTFGSPVHTPEINCGGNFVAVAGNSPPESGCYSGASGQDLILVASAHDDGHIDRYDTQRTARTDSQAHDSTVGNPVRTAVMDCGVNSGTVAGNFPLESGVISMLLTIYTLVLFRHPSVILRLVDGTPGWKHRHMMAREIRLVLKIFISPIITWPLV